MSLYAIGDLHLALGAPDKTMEVFQGRWQDYVEKLRKGFSLLTEDDTTVICGDFCWSMDLMSAVPDFRFLQELPGKKILLKGNHDYWWNTANKINTYFADNSFDTLSILHNNCVLYNDVALCGTRGWFFEEETGTAHDAKILRREVMRLEASLKAAGDREKLVFLHYPPLYQGYRCEELLQVLRAHGIRQCYYGHIHGKGCRAAYTGEDDGVNYHLISADFLDFVPYKVM